LRGVEKIRGKVEVGEKKMGIKSKKRLGGVEELGEKVEKEVGGPLHLSSEVREYVARMVLKRNYSKPRKKLENLGYSKVRIMKRGIG
jgi:hypothetical protein